MEVACGAAAAFIFASPSRSAVEGGALFTFITPFPLQSAPLPSSPDVVDGLLSECR